MMKKRLTLSVLLTALNLLAASAADTEADARAQLIEVGQRIVAIECEFVQTKESSMLAEKSISKGHMIYKKPGYIEWIYTEPFRCGMTMDGNHVTLLGENGAVSSDANSNRLFRELARIIVGNIDGSILLDENFFTSTVSLSDAGVEVTLAPKGRELKKMWTELILRYSKDNFQAQSFEMREASGDITIITFKNSHYAFSE